MQMGLTPPVYCLSHVRAKEKNCDRSMITNIEYCHILWHDSKLNSLRRTLLSRHTISKSGCNESHVIDLACFSFSSLNLLSHVLGIKFLVVFVVHLCKWDWILEEFINIIFLWYRASEIEMKLKRGEGKIIDLLIRACQQFHFNSNCSACLL